MSGGITNEAFVLAGTGEGSSTLRTTCAPRTQVDFRYCHWSVNIQTHVLRATPISYFNTTWLGNSPSVIVAHVGGCVRHYAGLLEAVFVLRDHETPHYRSTCLTEVTCCLLTEFIYMREKQ